MTHRKSLNLGNIIRTIRLRRGLTMKEVADRMGIRETTMRKYEMNELVPKTSTRIVMAKALEVSPALLLGNWTPDTAEAIGHLIAYFEMFGGAFVKKGGHTAIEFQGLSSFIDCWAEEYTQLKKVYAAASDAVKKTDTVDRYYSFLVSVSKTLDSRETSCPDPDAPSLQKAVSITLDNPPNLRGKKNPGVPG